MKYKIFIDGLSLPVLGMGTYGFGGKKQIDKSRDLETIELIQFAIENGFKMIDTAESYALGYTEKLLGQAIKIFPRQSLFIISKVSPWHLDFEGVISACHRSLKRLGTDYLDLYLIHHPAEPIDFKGEKIVSLEETMQAFSFLKRQGLIKNIGVSNFNVELLKQAQGFCEFPIVANEIEYNLLTRNEGEFTKNMEKHIIPFCVEEEIAVIAFRPFDCGRLLIARHFKFLDYLVEKYQASYAQIALAWLISKQGIVTIPKPDTKEHVLDNLKAVDLELEPEDIAKLDLGFQI